MAIYCLKCKSVKVKEIVEENKVLFFCADCQESSGRALVVDGKIKIINTSRGIKHIDAAAIIIRDNKLLLLERRTYPFGLMIPAGHLEYNETIEDALRREVFEEVGLKVMSETLIAQIEQPVSYCRYGSVVEEWAIFLTECDGKSFIGNNENEAIHWISLEDLATIPKDNFSPHTYVALKHLGYINADPKRSDLKTVKRIKKVITHGA